MNIKLISRYTGIALLFNALFMLISLFVSVFNGFDSSFSPLLISTLITIILGVFPIIFVRGHEDINIKEGFAIIVLSWILSCLVGMLPYVIWGGDFTLINAWFESVSGYTTTGSTILSDVESLPNGLLFWRSSTHFLGGIGVVIFMLMVLPAMSTFRLKISRLEISSISKENYRYQTKETVKIIVSVYLGITILSTIFLMISGMNFFDAINHAFSIVATGGFSTKNESLMSYNSFPIELVAIVFMIASGMHFGILYASIVERSNKIFKSPIIRLYLMTILVTSILITINLKLTSDVGSWVEAFRLSVFQVVSLHTTTGFATTDTSIWPSFSILMLMYVSIHTACSGSTTGGIKADRMWIFIQSVKTQIRKQLYPNAVMPVKVAGHALPTEIPYLVSMYIALYLFITILTAVIISFFGVDVIESFSASIAHIGNVGPAFGNCGSLGNYDYFPSIAKFLLTIEMLLGRLEIYPIIMFFTIFRRN